MFAQEDKAPGPDGFTIAVFQDCWDVIKEDLVRVFAEFHSSGIINQSTNASFIVLLPKKSVTKKISDFRPISLITSLYKIIAKVLSGRLRGVLHETIHSTQGAFVQGRQILDAILIANEIVDEKRRSGEEGVVLKIDFEKAYDHVILVNGNAKGWVKASRSLRQGDPLSPFLFTLVADILSRMLLRAEERNLLEGFRVGRNSTRVSHLQFADDTIFFSNTSEEDLQTFKSLLLAFGQISGLKVNLDKSNIYGINLKQNRLSRLAELLDCKASGLFTTWVSLWEGIPRLVAFGILVGEGKRDHLVSWDVVCKPKAIGGLGFGKIVLRNVALLGKWLWRYPREGSALWHKVISSIYGSHSNVWDANTIVRWSHHCPWKAISEVFQEFSKFTWFAVGNGDRIRSTRPFSWNFNFRRNLFDPEIEDLEGLMRSLECLQLTFSVQDARSWSLSSSGLFTVKSFFLALSHCPDSPSIFPTKFVWNSQVPFKVKSFVWLVAHKKLAKMDWVPPRSISDMLSITFSGFGLSRRGIVLGQATCIALIWVVW
ncbi:LINE-1 retrotransposable element ORF2 protein [Vitis vinifera]|uniref:LINE-1 retrotransposable element ORF2 protein n=1 Tax=Vitis vinifera TaxID=29760 RepID=A0A438K1G8_VITVI|nr:LINE-1 retrotransposable element ORF2 protein [Vitis vinifera]